MALASQRSVILNECEESLYSQCDRQVLCVGSFVATLCQDDKAKAELTS